MKDKREALIQELRKYEITYEDMGGNMQDDTDMDAIADFIIARERSMRDEINRMSELVHSRDCQAVAEGSIIQRLEQDNASLKATMGKIKKEILSEINEAGLGVSPYWKNGMKDALAILNEAEGK